MMKKKSHPEFVRALKARNLKITVVGTYENCLSRVAVRCDVCGWEWAPVGGSLWLSQVRGNHAEIPRGVRGGAKIPKG